MSDYEIVCKIAERLGLLEEYTGGQVASRTSSRMATKSHASPISSAGRSSREGLLRRPPGSGIGRTMPAGLIGFYEDPEKYPLSTPTGKLEYYSTGLAEHFPDDEERPPVAKWIPKGVYHEETIGTERSKKYPLLVMSNHPRWGVHSEHDDITWFREIETCKVEGSGRISVPSVVDQSGRRRSPRDQTRRRSLDLQRAR